MQRREFLQKAFQYGSVAAVASQCPSLLAQNSQQALFSTALAKDPRLLGWQGLKQDIAPHFSSWYGQLPAELEGRTLFRNGPGRQERGGERYSHWFDGDGFISQFKLSKQGVIHQGKFIQTAKHKEESQAGRFLYHGAGSKIANPKGIKGPQSINTANTSLLLIQGELWAMWEAGTPYRVSQSDLSTKGTVAFGADLQGVPFSAHPHHDADGSIWNFGDVSFGQQAAMLLYHLSAQGAVKRYQLVALPHHSYIHDFTVTDKYLIFYLPPMLRREGVTYMERFKWQASLGSRLLVIDKHDLSVVNTIELETGFAFHFGNSWQVGNELVINMCWYPDAQIMTEIMANIQTKQHANPYQAAKAYQIRVDLTRNRVRTAVLDHHLEFVQFDKRFVSQTTHSQFGITILDPSKDNEFDSIARIDTQTGRRDVYSFGGDCRVEEPLFIAKEGHSQEGEGYLIHTWLDFKQAKTGLAVFDAKKISHGPLAMTELPYYLPLGFHGTLV